MQLVLLLLLLLLLYSALQLSATLVGVMAEPNFEFPVRLLWDKSAIWFGTVRWSSAGYSSMPDVCKVVSCFWQALAWGDLLMLLASCVDPICCVCCCGNSCAEAPYALLASDSAAAALPSFDADALPAVGWPLLGAAAHAEGAFA